MSQYQQTTDSERMSIDLMIPINFADVWLFDIESF